MERITEFLLLLLVSWSTWLGGATTESVTDVSATTTAQVVQVIDGDTIDVTIAGREERVRYIGIDTPEPYRDAEPACYSLEASLRNEELVGGKLVQLVAGKEERDTYNRLLRYVYVEDTFVNAELVRDGFATTLPIPPNTRHASYLYELEQAAAAAERGLWGVCE